MFDRLRRLFGKPGTAEDDVRPDPDVARTRETGGHPAASADDAGTTGVGVSEDFVGRVAGQDEGFSGETGAEARGRGEATL